MSKVDELLSSPVGCNFLQSIVDTGVTVDQAVSVPMVFDLAHHSLITMMPWCMDEGDLRWALNQAPKLRGLAEEVVAHEDARWWFAHLDRAAQMWLGSSGTAFRAFARRDASSDERYFQQPWRDCQTSTVKDGSSFLNSGAEQQAGELIYDSPVHRRMYRVPPDARVFEVDGPTAWHDLCSQHPAIEEGFNHPFGAGMLVPDWTSVANAYDGVHMSLGGLLTASHVKVQSPAGWSYLWANETEATFWLHDVLVEGRRLPDITEFFEDLGEDDDRYIAFRIKRGRVPQYTAIIEREDSVGPRRIIEHHGDSEDQIVSYSLIRKWEYGRRYGRTLAE